MSRVTPGRGRRRGETRRRLARAAPGRSGPTWSDGGDQLRGATPPRRRPCGSACSTTTARETRHQLTEHILGIWHGALPGVRAGPALRLPGRRPVGPRAGAAVQPAQAAARPLRPGRQRASSPTTRRSSATTPATPGRARRTVDSRAVRAAQRGRRTTTSTGATTAGRARRWRDTVDLRAARQGLHRSCTTGSPSTCAARTPGWPRPRSTDYLRDLGVTAVELLPVHQFVSEPRAGRARAGQLLGLQHDRLLRPARGVLLRRATAASRCTSSRQMVKALPRGRASR